MEAYLNKIKERAREAGYKAEVNGRYLIVRMHGTNVIIETSKQLDIILKEAL